LNNNHLLNTEKTKHRKRKILPYTVFFVRFFVFSVIFSLESVDFDCFLLYNENNKVGGNIDEKGLH